MGLAHNISNKRPDLKNKLFVAGLYVKPEEYVKEKLKLATYVALTLGVVLFMLFQKNGTNFLLLIPIIIVIFYMMFHSMMKQADSLISKRGKEIDKDVLFAGRFLMVKLNSGQPLIKAIEDATKSYGVSNKFFKEIIRDINLGTPLERSLEKATIACPSKKLKKILFQMTNALKIGTDVTNFLEAILDEIADEQLIEIKRYGKKLNSITMFYMLFAVVMPSLGMTMMIIVISMISVNINNGMFGMILLGLMFMQFVFITVFRSIRPSVHI